MKKKNQDNWDPKKKNIFPKNLQVFLTKKYQCLLWWFTTIAIVILYLENGVVIFKMDFY